MTLSQIELAGIVLATYTFTYILVLFMPTIKALAKLASTKLFILTLEVKLRVKTVIVNTLVYLRSRRV